METKNYLALTLALVFLTLTTVGVNAQPFFEVAVNGLSSVHEPLSVIRGDNVRIKTTFELDADGNPANIAVTEDAFVRAELSYRHGKEVVTKTVPFDVIDGTTYRKYLSLEIPEDIDATLPGESYWLAIELKDGAGRILHTAQFEVKVQRANDLLSIIDLDIGPAVGSTSSIKAGEFGEAVIVLKNIGADRQDDIRIKLSVPELGITEKEYIGDLTPVDCEDKCEKEDTAKVEIVFKVPRNAENGIYDVRVLAYNSNTRTEETAVLKVDGQAGSGTGTGTGTTGTIKETIIGIDALSKQAAPNQGITYAISLTNAGNAAQTYTAEILGTVIWASARADPSAVTLQPGQSATINVFVAPFARTLPGEHKFTVNIIADNQVIKSLPLKTDVTAAKSTLKQSLVVAAIILLVILIVLAIVIAVTRTREEPESEEKENYY